MSETTDNKYEVEQARTPWRDFIANREEEPIVYGDVIRELGLAGTQVNAKDLIGETFTIYRAKPFKSSFKQSNDPWYCVIALPNDSEPYTVVLGGGACTEVLEAFAQAGYERPLTVKLGWKEGGAFGGYYVFE
jgi:hypothetical protein